MARGKLPGQKNVAAGMRFIVPLERVLCKVKQYIYPLVDYVPELFALSPVCHGRIMPGVNKKRWLGRLVKRSGPDEILEPRKIAKQTAFGG